MESFAVRGDPIENVREVAVNTTDNADMFGNIDKLDNGVANGDRDRMFDVFFVARGSRRKIDLKFCFGRRKLTNHTNHINDILLEPLC